MGHGSWGKAMLRLLHAHLLRAYPKSRFKRFETADKRR